MEDERALDAPVLARLAGHPHPEVRARAALAGGRVGDVRALPLLVAAAADSAPLVRAAAVFALGELGDTSAAAHAPILAALAGSDSAAIEAPGALAKLNTPTGYAAVHGLLLARSGLPARQRAPAGTAQLREALLSIWRFTPRPGAADAALPYIDDADPELRWAATYSFARVPAPASVIATLLPLLQDGDALVRATAARTLRPAQVDSAGLRAAAGTALRAALGDAHPHVRINAARALAAFREAEDAGRIQALALRDADANVRIAAAEALASLPSASPMLGRLAADAAAPLALRFAALTSLARVDSAAALPIAHEWAGATAWVQRLYAARVLGAVRWPAPETTLRQLARDSDPRVQGEAFGALADADSTAPLGPFLLEGLASPDPLVRAAAARGLGRRTDPAYLSALMQAYERAQRDSINDAALAALDALAALARGGAPVAQSFFFRFQRSRDPIVRARVAQHFGTGADSWGQPNPTGAARSAAFYEGVVRELVAPALGGVLPRVRIRTARGDIVLDLSAADAPLTVHNFLDLVASGFYRRPELRWHRVVPNFVLQDGDPRGDGSGGPDRVIRDEINPLRYRRGALGMALSGPDTGGSQYFLTHSPQPHLDGGYTIFGRVVEGMDVADAIVQDDAILAIEVVR